jgi:hypothetical protein
VLYIERLLLTPRDARHGPRDLGYQVRPSVAMISPHRRRMRNIG